MKFKKSLLVICLIICLFSMVSVSAADVNDTFVTGDINNITKQMTDDDFFEDDEFFYDDDFFEDDDLIEDNDYYNFDYFDYEVNSGESKITLTHDYINDFNPDDYEEWETPVWYIEESVEIDGNNHVLDWNHFYNTIHVEADNVVFKNTIFKNFKDSAEEYNAIDWSGKNGLMENCTFIGNTFSHGLLMINGKNMVINNCKFISNDGGTIVWLNENNPTLKNCEFKSNIVEESGNNFIFSQVGNGIISNNKFKDNFYANSNAILCFDPFTVEEDRTVGRNFFLNNGVILNNGIKRTSYDLFSGGVFEAVVIGADGKAVGAGETVKVNFNIDFSDGSVDADDNPIIVKTNTLTYTLKTDSNGFIKLNVDDIVKDSRIASQSMIFKYSRFGANSWGVFISTELDEKKQSSSQSIQFEYKGSKTSAETVSIKSSIAILDVDGFWFLENIGKSSIVDYNKYAKYTFSSYFFDLNGDFLSNREVTIKIGPNTYKTKTDKYGFAFVTAKLNYGTYNVLVKNPVTKQELSDSIKVVKRLTNNKDVTKFYKSQTTYKVRVFGDNGKIAKGTYVTFVIGKTMVNVKTDSKGYATLKLNQKPGKYTVIVKCGAHTVSNKITIKSTIVTNDLTKKVKKPGKFNVKILNSKGKAFAKQAVKIKFKGKSYSLKTNNKGIASFNIPTNLKAGKYVIKTTYNGYTASNKITLK